MMVQRWGILRMAMPKGLRIKRIIALVNALAKLHNFCIDEKDDCSADRLLNPLSNDTLHIMSDVNGFVPLEAGREHGTLLPRALMDGGHHFSDIPRSIRRQLERQLLLGSSLAPRQQLLEQVINSHLKRPSTNIK